MYFKFKSLFLLIISVFVLVGCSVDKSIIPSYIYINKFKLITDANIEGDTSADILDVWLYQNNEFKGSFGLPTYIPIIEKEKQFLTLRGGVKRSGQDEERLQYPLFTSFYDTIPFANLRSDTINPVVSYAKNCKFKIVQDFDGNSSFFSISNKKSGDSIVLINDQTAWKKGNNCAKIALSDSTDFLRYLSKELTGLPANGIPLFLELDYKCVGQFSVSLAMVYQSGEQKSYPVFIANSSSGLWKKLYLDLAPEISSEIATRGVNTKFYVYIQVNKEDQTNLFLDNIKLIHF